MRMWDSDNTCGLVNSHHLNWVTIFSAIPRFRRVSPQTRNRIRKHTLYQSSVGFLTFCTDFRVSKQHGR